MGLRVEGRGSRVERQGFRAQSLGCVSTRPPPPKMEKPMKIKILSRGMDQDQFQLKGPPGFEVQGMWD